MLANIDVTVRERCQKGGYSALEDLDEIMHTRIDIAWG